MTINNNFFDTHAPLRVGTVRLKVRDLDAVSTFYQSVLGLSAVATSDHRVTLGVGSSPLLVLEGDSSLSPLDPRQAGLFHTAFLMPTRSDLARWVAHVAEARVPLQGASDHIVSEAIYLADPEGNGIEVYADRPVSAWLGEAGEIQMSTDPLDLPGLLQSAEGTEWSGFPNNGSIGHVWNSRRVGKRPEGMAGLDAVEILVRSPNDLAAIAARAESAGNASITDTNGLTLHDPWGTAITLRT